MTRTSASRLVLLGALALALALPIGPAAAQGTTISFLTPPWGQPPDPDAFAAWQAESGITVEVQSVQTADLFTRVATAMGTGQPAADVIFLTEEAPSNVVATGAMQPLDDIIAAQATDLSDFTKVDFWQINGQTFGIPVYNQLVMMDYNTVKLADAGVTTAPTTWADFTAAANAVKTAGIDEYPIAFGAIDWSWYLMALSSGDPMFDADLNPVFADAGSPARAAMATLLGYFADGLISPEMLAGSINQHQLFWSGVGALHQGWQGSVVSGNAETSKQAPNVAYLLLPDQHFTWSFPAAIGIGNGSPNADAAYSFITWYTQPEQATAIFGAYGLYPSRTSVAEALNEEGKIVGYDVIVEQSGYVHELPRQAVWWGPFATATTEAVLSAAQTGTPADEVIDGLASEWNDLKAEFE